MKPEYKLVVKASYVRMVEGLAAEIWPEAFRRWLNGKQAKQLLSALQSEERIAQDIDSDVNYFLILLAGKPVGYFAFSMTPSTVVLEHLYLQPTARRRHLGRDVVQYCERLGRGDEKSRISLTVHQKDLNTIAFCKALGFRPLRPCTIEGGGLVLPATEWEKRL